jgi:hypothetical protein
MVTEGRWVEIGCILVAIEILQSKLVNVTNVTSTLYGDDKTWSNSSECICSEETWKFLLSLTSAIDHRSRHTYATKSPVCHVQVAEGKELGLISVSSDRRQCRYESPLCNIFAEI